MTHPCAEASREVDEPLAGTAAEGVKCWIALEYTRPWAAKPLAPSSLPDRVKAHLNEALHTIDGARFQFIRSPGRTAEQPTLLVACVESRALLRVQLDRYEDLLSIDFDAMVRDGDFPGAELVNAPVYLVCTHGKRDRCCAREGGALFRAMRETDAEVWQTSHLGGHRFAACLASLPDGLVYGRLHPEDGGPLVEAHQRNQLYSLRHFRGRASLDRPAQAAEIFLRRRAEDLSLDAWAWDRTETSATDQWKVTFDHRGAEHSVEVKRETLSTFRPTSCDGEQEPITRFVELGP